MTIWRRECRACEIKYRIDNYQDSTTVCPQCGEKNALGTLEKVNALDFLRWIRALFEETNNEDFKKLTAQDLIDKYKKELEEK